MQLDEIEKWYLILANFGFGALIGGLVIYFFVKNFLPSYLSKKAENLADKEDIAQITKEVEKVKTDYQKVLEEIRVNNQIRVSAIEREKTIKKEVYMDAAEAVTKALNMIERFSNLKLSEEVLSSEFSSESGKIAKVQIVGTGKTVKAITELMSSIGTAILDLMLRRSPLIQRNNLISINENLRAKSKAEVDRYISMMKNLNLQGITDEKVWNPLNRALNFENEQIDLYDKKIDSLSSTQGKEHLEYIKLCMNKHFEISCILPNVILAIREELDLDINPDEYLDIYNRNMVLAKKTFDVFIEKVPNA